ncbi:hypothetical protein CEXT_530861 [Caerostris extrusa]|uniref:Uncharacterized protein n=1 Tax=Caerostris extrusa TaxID=172846 RepID=A0AAV4S8H3_CAEEX|nr:hypothetical protein CEXT_530861 [Caerostris extrusa]
MEIDVLTLSCNFEGACLKIVYNLFPFISNSQRAFQWTDHTHPCIDKDSNGLYPLAIQLEPNKRAFNGQIMVIFGIENESSLNPGIDKVSSLIFGVPINLVSSL